MISKNKYLLSLQLLVSQLLTAAILFLIFSFIGIKLPVYASKSSVMVISFFTFNFLLSIFIIYSLPAMLIGYLYSKEFNQAISVNDRKIISLVTTILFTMITLSYATIKYYKKEPSFTISSDFILSLSIFALFFLICSFVIFYFLKIGNNLYLKNK